MYGNGAFAAISPLGFFCERVLPENVFFCVRDVCKY